MHYFLNSLNFSHVKWHKAIRWEFFRYIDNEKDLRHIMASLGGSVYSNINHREEDIAEVFESSLDLLQSSHNNTKENVKINVIAGKGNRKEKTDGVEEYEIGRAHV